jgi:prophage maintenance system killer protein
MDLILDLNGINAIWDVEEVGQKMVLLSQSKLDEADLAQWLRQMVVYIRNISWSAIFRLKVTITRCL